MSTYRYMTTDVLSGVTLADTVPLRVQGFDAAIGGLGSPGRLTGHLDLGAHSAVAQTAYLAALEPRRSILWALQDEFPVWCGVIWNTPIDSMVSNHMPVEATELSSLFSRRQVRANQSYASSADKFAVVQGLLNYALAKTNGAIANLVVGTDVSGSTVGGSGVTFSAANLPKVLDCVSQYCAQYNIEYVFQPGWNAGHNAPTVTLKMGSPHLGRTQATTGLQLIYPSTYVTDYSFPRVGASSVNSLVAVANNSGAIPWQSDPTTHGLNSAELTAGYPLLEDSIALNTAVVTSQAQIDAYADGKLPLMTGTTVIPSVTIGGGGTPTVGQISLGDEATLIATSPYHPADPNTGAPGLQQLVRVIRWSVTPFDVGQVEKTHLQLGGVTV